ncbi:MAG TPA: ECF-type sigma factor [Tepidisphaeraceae bacterium]|nr:ECF-type sigma factor [Tepidisphaeraceae bacterium]
MSESINPEVTLLLKAAGHDPSAANKLLPIVYEELRMLARSRLKHERAGHTLQATALVHEAYVKLIGSSPVTWENRAHFFGACANAMRQILVDHARSKGAQKRGGGLKAEALSSNDVVDTRDLDLVLSIDECLEKLKAEDERAAEVVQLRFFGGLEMSEIAEALGLSERTVHREWAFARVRLLQLLGEPGASETKG